MPDDTGRMGKWMVLAIILAASVPYIFTVSDYFLQDDFGVVQIFARRPWTMFPKWFVMPWTEDIWGYTPDELRPFVALTYQLTGKWNPSRPELHHIFNVALHVANALLVFSIARLAIGLSALAAGFAGVIFAVLPGQVESVVWITGRVDSMPTFFYLATFLSYVDWRQHRRWSAYAGAMSLFFVALFSKQNTITMVATLAVYDLLCLTAEQRGPLYRAVVAWSPFAVMTAGFLILRRLVFGHSLRAGQHAGSEIDAVTTMLGHHLRRTITGQLAPFTNADLALVVLLIVALILVLVRSAPPLRTKFVRGISVFGLIWIAIGAAPVALAGYESPRHIYLASAGWAFILALTLEGAVMLARLRSARPVAMTVATLVVAFYMVRLVPVLRVWHTFASISEAGTVRVQQEAADAVPGTLLMVGLPLKSWEWSAPFMLSPPFAPVELARRVHMVTPWRLHCCGTENWDVYTRAHLRAWIAASPRPPIIALRYSPGTGVLSRVTDKELPELAEIVPVLLQTSTPQTLDGVITDILEKMVAGRR
ncbi:MAG: hypothetical protein ABIS06_09530 [Vicinamibacterales bacterium]